MVRISSLLPVDGPPATSNGIGAARQIFEKLSLSPVQTVFAASQPNSNAILAA